MTLKPGNRIFILGPAGSGKSTMAKMLGQSLGIGVYHLDQCRHEWGGEVTEERVRKITKDAEWIVEGMYHEILGHMFKTADTVYYLDLSADVCVQSLQDRFNHYSKVGFAPHAKRRTRQDVDELKDRVRNYKKSIEGPHILPHLEKYKSKVVAFTGRECINDFLRMTHLRADTVMSGLVDAHGDISSTISPSGDYFADLVGQIIGQQLSVKAAATIHARVVALIGAVTPENVLRTSDQEYRAAGMSQSKTKYIKSLASAVVDGELGLAALATLDDDGVVVELVKIKGIGKWTAEMFLIFSLGRPDVFSHGDGGLRSAMWKLYGATTPDEIDRIAKRWSPYRSHACLYLWRSLDNTPG